MLRDLAEDEVPELLRLVAEVQHLAVLAHHRQLLLAHVDDELRAQDGVVAGGDDAHLDGGARRRVHRAQVARDERVLQVLGHRVQHEHGPQPEHRKVYCTGFGNNWICQDLLVFNRLRDPTCARRGKF